MSWRRFQVLLRCLSPQSHTVTRLNSDRFIGGKRDDTVSLEGAKNVDNWFSAKFAK